METSDSNNPEELTLSSRGLVWAACLFVVSLYYFLSFAFYGANSLDEGYLFNPALRVMNGELPGRDYYHFYPPGRFYFFAMLFSIFGPTMAVGRIALAILHALECVLAWQLASRFTNKRWGLIAWLGIMICPGPAQKVFFGLSVLATLLALEWALRSTYQKKWFIYGLVIGVVTLFRHDVGGFGTMVGAVAILFNNKDKGFYPLVYTFKSGALICLGIIAIIVGPSLYWAYEGVFLQLVSQLFSAARAGNQANRIPYPLPLEMFSGGLKNSLRAMLFYMPIIVYIWGAIYLLRLKFRPSAHDMMSEAKKKADLRAVLLATVIMGVLCLNQARVRSDLPHLYQAIVPVFVLVPALCYHAFRSKRWMALALLPVILSGSQTFSHSGIYHGTPSVFAGRNTRLQLNRGHLMLTRAEADEFRGVLEFIKKHSKRGEYILVLPDAPLIYFMAERANPTPFELMRMGRFDTPEKEAKVIESLKKHPPVLVVYRDQDYLSIGRRFEDYAPLIDKFIKTNYRPEGRAVTFKLLLPISDTRN